jgi:hypothetical protein
MKKIIIAICTLFSLASNLSLASESNYVSVDNGTILNYEETKVLCEVVLNPHSGETTLGFIKKYAQKLESKDPKEFLFKYGTSIKCYGRSFIYFVMFKGHLDDVEAILKAGFDPNWIIEDTLYRKMTMLDYLRILYAEETDEVYKSLIKKKRLKVRRAGGRTCDYLNYTTCEFDKTF